MSKLWTCSPWCPILGVCSGIKVDLFVNEGSNRQSLCPSVSWRWLCCSWVCWGQVRQFRVASGCAPGWDFPFPCCLSSVMMTELLEGSLCFWCGLILDEAPKFFRTGLSWEPHCTFLSFLLLHVPAFTSLSCVRASLFSVTPRMPTSVPCDVTFHQALPDYVIFLQNMVFDPAWTGPAGAADSHQSV